LEASDRIGGRIYTSYLNGTQPGEYQYQEMGPMRFPVKIKRGNETYPIKDHQMVFQLADALNKRNGNASDLAVNFIKWIENSPNTPKSRVNKTALYSNNTAAVAAKEAFAEWVGLDDNNIGKTSKEFSDNIFKAHKKAIQNGHLDWSEAQYIHHKLNVNLNLTDQIASTGQSDPSWIYDDIYFSAAEWTTIDKGISSLWRAMEPFMLNRTTLNARVAAMAYDTKKSKMTVRHRRTNADPFKHRPDEDSSEFDYVFVSVPFSVVRSWPVNPPFSSLLSRAISTINYFDSCKVALHYKTRFWEHLRYPIYGGCGKSDIPLLGSVCYPSYNINATGPGVLLASYSRGIAAKTLGSMSEAEHVAWAQRAMVDIHGPVADEEYTGNYDRVCWASSPYQAGGWSQPTAGQQELYLPAYFKTEMKTVFIGEHTSYTHGWIWSALESAVRGTVQLLLEMGLVDEAKEVIDTWMARWISV
jgi:monoamine oxidase